MLDFQRPLADEEEVTGSESGPKAWGAYYTDEATARFLCRWTIRSGLDRVLDPSFGGGVFLRSAAKRLIELGGDSKNVFGIEMDPAVYCAAGNAFRQEFGARQSQLWAADFFSVAPGELSCDAIIGNPPFIRYQSFTGDSRRRAHERAEQAAVRLPKLASSWAPFIVHATSMLRPGGRLGMVVPAEIGYATYARPVLRHLARTFGSLRLLTFRESLFPLLSEDTMLLLADEHGSTTDSLQVHDIDRLADLENAPDLATPYAIGIDALARGKRRLSETYISPAARSLLSHIPSVRLGEAVDVGIGYVTGANSFFHLRTGDVERHQLPSEVLAPAVFKARALRGLRFTTSDQLEACANGDAGYLFRPSPELKDHPAVSAYIRHGESLEIATSYKCRNRTPWYVVPHVYPADGYLSSMIGVASQLVQNSSGSFAPNSLHVLRRISTTPLGTLATMWRSSFCELSCEVEGHALGGGMLKLEPAEAEAVRVPSVTRIPEAAVDLIDAKLRKGENVRTYVDAMLQAQFGLTSGDIDSLRDAVETLRRRRGIR